ncbi:hypothetical protein C0992_003090 [Termitomyces sp. T32_za158]|nr:hypothetical protein C0992_003090 [Termitomyces sp. T32_za158]
MATEIQQLSHLIASSVSILLQACEDCNTPFPDPDQPLTPQSEAFRASQVVIDATNVIAASALQLVARVLPPHMSLMNIVSGPTKSAALRTALELNVTEILREAGPQVFSVSDGAKLSSQVLETIKDPVTGPSHEPNHAPFNRAFGVDDPLWVWYESQEQQYRRRRFAIAMHGIAQMQPPDLLDDVLDWKALPQGSIIVDVGGGIGTSSLAVAKKNDHLKLVVQDLPTICAEATAYWSKEYPKLIDTGKLSFSPHDFFTQQPVTDASVFILKQILHDWSDPYCACILTELRAAATPETKLIVVDSIISYACHDPTTKSDLNSDYKEAPAPLLPNYGAANVMPYFLDLAVRHLSLVFSHVTLRNVQMMMWVNAQERTIGHLDTLLRSTGWRIVSAKRRAPPSNFYEPVVAVPI